MHENSLRLRSLAHRFTPLALISATSMVVGAAACVGDTAGPQTLADAAPIDATTADASSVDGATDSPSAADTGVDAPVVTITDIAAGASHACALASNGAVYCWGDNAVGEVGVPVAKNASCVGGNGAPNGCVTAPTLVPGLSAIKVAAGSLFTCAVDKAGDVWCWGYNNLGQLGHASGAGDTQCTVYSSATVSGPLVCNATPTKVLGLSNVVDITAGASHACARTASNAVYCWGDNASGQIGNTAAGAATPTPLQPTNLPAVIEIHAGLDRDTCAVAVSNGAIWCWGDDDWGQLDVAPQDACPGLCSKIPRQAIAADGGAYSGATHVQVAHAYTCATFGATATCWGLNYRGIISGNGPAPIVGGAASGLEMRWEAQCTLTGGRSCWGYNGSGALGDGTFAPVNGNVLSTPESLTTPTNVTKLSAGINFYLALTQTNEVWAWGSNYGAQLGHAQSMGTPADVHCEGNSTFCNAVPQKISGLP